MTTAKQIMASFLYSVFGSHGQFHVTLSALNMRHPKNNYYSRMTHK